MFLEIQESTGIKQGDIHEIDSLKTESAPAYFDYQLSQNVSAVLGKTAFLTCVVKNLKPTQKVFLPEYEIFVKEIFSSVKYRNIFTRHFLEAARICCGGAEVIICRCLG